MYNKLFSKIVTSSVWLEPSDHRVVWITFIALMDKDGFVPIASVANMAHTARVSLESAQKAIKAFESPDPLDPEQEFEGRRIEKVPNGWMVLNAEKYANMATSETAREQTRKRVKAFRERKRNACVTEPSVTDRDVTKPVTQSYSDHTQIRSDSEKTLPTLSIEKSDSEKSHRDDPHDQSKWLMVKSSYPIGMYPGADWLVAERMARDRIAEGDATWAELEAGAARYAEQCIAAGTGTKFVRSPKAFFAVPGRMWAEPFPKPDKPAEPAMDAAKKAWIERKAKELSERK